MYEISVRLHFDAAHSLRGYHGKCEKLHGHRYEVVAGLLAPHLNEVGLAYDFLELKKQLGEVISRFDHNNLNEISPFDKLNPSAENLASYIYGQLQSAIGKAPVKVAYIEVWESPENRVVYRP
jgi:6-pyruvoyltetrahydropterin/6-carboxytetrahydropterin synthase